MESNKTFNRVAVIGSRSIEDVDWINYQLDMLFKDEKPSVVVSGGARGVDSIAQEWAEGEGIPTVMYKPYHLVDNKVDYTPRYFFMRNKQIVDNSDTIVALWDGESHGTKGTLRYASFRNKDVIVIKYDGGLDVE